MLPDCIPVPREPTGERPRSGGDVEDSSLFSNIARRFRTPPLDDLGAAMMTGVTVGANYLLEGLWNES